MAVKPTIRSNDVLAYFDRVGDAWKSSGSGAAEHGSSEKRSALGDGGLVKMVVDQEMDRQRERLTAQAPSPQQLAKDARDQRAPEIMRSPQQPAQQPQEPAKKDAPAREQPSSQRAPQEPGAQRRAEAPGQQPANGTNANHGAEAPRAFARFLVPHAEHAHHPHHADSAKLGNQTESANVARFFKDPGVPTESKNALKAWKGSDFRGDETGAFVEIRERRDRKAEERRREDRADDLRAGAGDGKRGEVKETRDAREVDRGAGGEELMLEELRDKTGGAWLLEKPAETEAERENMLRIEDSLGEAHRCRGVLEDGTRCIRKPMMGVPYCREHAVQAHVGDLSAAPPPPDAAAPGSVEDLHVETHVEPLEGEPTDPGIPVYVVTD